MTLTFHQYQMKAHKTAVYPGQHSIMGLLYVALGLGEAGEVQGKVKKILRDHGGILTLEVREAIKHELGDVLWYIAACCDEIGCPMEVVARDNINKLSDRSQRGAIHGDGDNR